MAARRGGGEGDRFEICPLAHDRNEIGIELFRDGVEARHLFPRVILQSGERPLAKRLLQGGRVLGDLPPIRDRRCRDLDVELIRIRMSAFVFRQFPKRVKSAHFTSPQRCEMCRLDPLKRMVPRRGLEPPWGYPHCALNAARLPISPPRSARAAPPAASVNWYSRAVGGKAATVPSKGIIVNDA